MTAEAEPEIDREAVVASETERRPRAGWCAIAAAFFALVGSIALALAYQDIPDDSTSQLLHINDHKAEVIASTISLALGSLFIMVPLLLLYDAVKVRKSGIPRIVRFLLLFGGFGFAITQVALIVYITIQAGDFAKGTKLYEPISGVETVGPYAKEILDSPFRLAMGLIGQMAQLGLAIALILIALNSMRVGLLSRFMGYLGIIAGVLFVIPIGSPVPIVQTFWLGALAMLLWGRWPSPLPAWDTGEAVPWPSAQEQREAKIHEEGGGSKPPAQRPASGGLLGRMLGAKPEPEPEAPAKTTNSAPRTSAPSPATSKKKKRKRR